VATKVSETTWNLLGIGLVMLHFQAKLLFPHVSTPSGTTSSSRRKLFVYGGNFFSALTFKDFVPRLELLTHFRDFRKSLQMSKMNHLSLFCKSCLVLFLTLIMALRFYVAWPQIWYCCRHFWSCSFESPELFARAWRLAILVLSGFLERTCYATFRWPAIGIFYINEVFQNVSVFPTLAL